MTIVLSSGEEESEGGARGRKQEEEEEEEEPDVITSGSDSDDKSFRGDESEEEEEEEEDDDDDDDEEEATGASSSSSEEDGGVPAPTSAGRGRGGRRHWTRDELRAHFQNLRARREAARAEAAAARQAARAAARAGNAGNAVTDGEAEGDPGRAWDPPAGGRGAAAANGGGNGNGEIDEAFEDEDADVDDVAPDPLVRKQLPAAPQPPEVVTPLLDYQLELLSWAMAQESPACASIGGGEKSFSFSFSSFLSSEKKTPENLANSLFHVFLLLKTHTKKESWPTRWAWARPCSPSP